MNLKILNIFFNNFIIYNNLSFLFIQLYKFKIKKRVWTYDLLIDDMYFILV